MIDLHVGCYCLPSSISCYFLFLFLYAHFVTPLVHLYTHTHTHMCTHTHTHVHTHTHTCAHTHTHTCAHTHMCTHTHTCAHTHTHTPQRNPFNTVMLDHVVDPENGDLMRRRQEGVIMMQEMGGVDVADPYCRQTDAESSTTRSGSYYGSSNSITASEVPGYCSSSHAPDEVEMSDQRVSPLIYS